MAGDDFGVPEAIRALEEELIQQSRAYEDAKRYGDEQAASEALLNYATAKHKYESLFGAANQQQQPGQLSVAQRNFLSRRAAGGDELAPRRMQDYALAHTRAVNAGLQVDSPEYFATIERYADSMGDGRQPPLNEREVAKMCGIDEATYAEGAEKLAALKRAGLYRDGQ